LREISAHMPKRSLAILLPVLTLLASACSTNNVTVDNGLQNYFDSAGVHGTFGLYDNGQGHFTIYNLPRFRDSAITPGPTFDILQSLIAIQTGTVKDGKSLMPDSLTLTQAFQTNSAANDSVFQQLALRLGKDTLKKWIDSLRYGNKDMNGFPAGAFWNDNHLRITTDEQMGLIKKLYFDQLPFFQRTQQIVRDMFQKEENSNYRLVYKTGVITLYEKHFVGWITGWVEENKHPYFFVVNFETDDPSMNISAVGLQLVKKILAPMGFFAGKK
jgi:beta-lactamase class D